MVLLEPPPPTIVASDSRRAEGRSNQRRSSQRHSQRPIELLRSKSHRTSHREESRHPPAPPHNSERTRRESTLRPSIDALNGSRVSNSRPSRHDSLRTPTQRQLEPEPSHGRSQLRRNATVGHRPNRLRTIDEQPDRESGMEKVSVMEKVVVGIKRIFHGEREGSTRRRHYADEPSLRETGRSLMPASRDSRRYSGVESSRHGRNHFSRNDRGNFSAGDGAGNEWELVEEVRVYREDRRPPTTGGGYMNVIDEDRNILHRKRLTESKLGRAANDAEIVQWREKSNGEMVPKEVWFIDR